eukprot:5468980-Amphidinium_carterae.2
MMLTVAVRFEISQQPQHKLLKDQLKNAPHEGTLLNLRPGLSCTPRISVAIGVNFVMMLSTVMETFPSPHIELISNDYCILIDSNQLSDTQNASTNCKEVLGSSNIGESTILWGFWFYASGQLNTPLLEKFLGVARSLL